MPAARKDFDGYHGGRVNPQDDAPKRLRYPCFAAQCPMPGTIWTARLDSGKNEPGACAWHYSANPSDIPKITRVLLDWQGLSFEINECRRVHTASETACDPKAQDALFAVAIERLRPFVQAGGWKDEFERKGQWESYAAWGRRLEAFLGARVVEVLSTHQRRAA